LSTFIFLIEIVVSYAPDIHWRVGDRQTPAIDPCGLIVLTMRAPTEIDDKK